MIRKERSPNASPRILGNLVERRFIIIRSRCRGTFRLCRINLSKDIYPFAEREKFTDESIYSIKSARPRAHLFFNRYKFSTSRSLLSPFLAAILDCLAHRIAHATYGNINLTVVGIYEQKWSHLHARKAKFMRGAGI